MRKMAIVINLSEIELFVSILEQWSCIYKDYRMVSDTQIGVVFYYKSEIDLFHVGLKFGAYQSKFIKS